MAKKKSGGGKSKNPELRGGKNTLPRDSSGNVDVKKIVKVGAQEQKKKWVDKKVVKNRPKPNIPTKPKASTVPTKPLSLPSRGINKLKVKAQQPLPNDPAKKIPSKAVPTKGENRLIVRGNGRVAQSKTSPVKESVKTSGLPTKGISSFKAKAQTIAKKPAPKKVMARGK